MACSSKENHLTVLGTIGHMSQDDGLSFRERRSVLSVSVRSPTKMEDMTPSVITCVQSPGVDTPLEYNLLVYMYIRGTRVLPYVHKCRFITTLKLCMFMISIIQPFYSPLTHPSPV